ncbi:MAG: CoA transferase, partial [Candidatus Binataceae bacterium]
MTEPRNIESAKDRPAGMLAGITVIECGDGISAAFGAKMLADLGADVIKAEAPDGDSTRRRGPFPIGQPNPELSGLFLYLNNNKRGVTLDLAKAEGRQLLDHLLSKADILIHNVHPRDRAAAGLDGATLERQFPNLIISGISPFGDTGPYKNWNAYPLNVENAGGMAFLAPVGSQYPELPPLKAFGGQSEYQAGVHACYAILAAYWSRLNGGRAERIEIAAQECLAAMLEQNLMHYTYTGRETSRLGRRVIGPWLLAECSDGVIFVACAEEAQWQRMVEVMGNPEWAREELFKDRLARGENADALNLFIREWASSWKARELFLAGQAKRVPFATVNTMKRVYEDDQLNFRKYFVTVDYPGTEPLRMPGAPSRYGEDSWAIRTIAPRLGQHNAEVFGHAAGIGSEEPAALTRSAAIPKPAKSSNQPLPLAGIRVLDFTWAWAGPFATLQLAHMGAEVIRVESVKRPCITRMIPPFADDVPGPNRAGYFNQYNQGKRSITVDLSTPDGLQVIFDLAPQCDIVVENFAGGVMARMGLGYSKLVEYRSD